MDLNFCFSPAIELTGSNHMRYRRELIPLFITASLRCCFRRLRGERMSPTRRLHCACDASPFLRTSCADPSERQTTPHPPDRSARPIPPIAR